jgi:SAM-dependent methyltransferase
MKNQLITIIRSVRAVITKIIRPKSKYWLATKSTTPISTKFGYDRGTPIDRYWIEDFLQQNKELISGKCLEITDASYVKKYGNNVTSIDVLDINKDNPQATIIGDLRNLNSVIPNDSYDCLVLTHVLGLIDDIDAGISECKRILKPGGVLLVTSSCISPAYEDTNFWRFTSNGAKYLFNKHFGKDNVNVTSYGNVLTGQCFWVGIAQEELTEEQLKYNDPKYPCIVAILAKKESDV